MNNRVRAGKSSEYAVAGQLIRHGLDVYLPCVDDQAIDLVLRTEDGKGIRYYDIQVKSVKGYNRIVGLKPLRNRQDKYILVIHYRHNSKPVEFFYLSREQIARHYKKDSPWGDLVFNKADREEYARQDLADLARRVLNAQL